VGMHDSYGKVVMRNAAGGSFSDTVGVFTPYGKRGGATIDGVVGKSIAVEIESRVPKQVRGALLDLICHPYSKKLLILLPVHMTNPVLCADQCSDILARFVERQDYRVVLLNGTGDTPDLENDVVAVRRGLAELTCAPA
jgi:hypothetical protein